MYVQHPYKYEGKYYAKIDGVFYEISKEVAMAMTKERLINSGSYDLVRIIKIDI